MPVLVLFGCCLAFIGWGLSEGRVVCNDSHVERTKGGSSSVFIFRRSCQQFVIFKPVSIHDAVINSNYCLRRRL
jgi:hypothetical protein